MRDEHNEASGLCGQTLISAVKEFKNPLMIIDEKLLEHLSGLSRLLFKAGQCGQLCSGVSEIPPFVEKFSKVYTTGLAPLFSNTGQGTALGVFIGRPLSLIEAFAIAAERKENFFRWPEVQNK